MIEGLTACFVGIADPRATRRRDHRLIDILVIAACAVIACAESREDIELYGRSKQAWLKTFLALPNGIPSHDTFRRVFMLIDPDAFEACFARWAQSLTGRVVYRPRMMRHRAAAYAASAADGSWSCRTALGGLNPCRSISQVELSVLRKSSSARRRSSTPPKVGTHRRFSFKVRMKR